MKKKTLWLSAIAITAALAVFTACGGGNNNDNGDDNNVTPPVEQTDNQNQNQNQEQQAAAPAVTAQASLDALADIMARFPSTLENTAPILQRGDAGNVLRMVVGSPNTFPGLFERVLSSEAFDSTIMDFQWSNLVSWDGTFMYTDDGIATISIEEDANGNGLVVLNMRDGVNPTWHDGTPFTLDDLVFAYELKAHDDIITGVGFGIRFVETHFSPWVVGINEWRNGEADHISGMVLSNNNRTLHIYYDRPLPPSAQYSGGIWLQASPRHWLEPAIAEVGWAQLYQHPRARHEALGMGPFVIDSIVPGQAVVFVANDDYWRGAPLLDGLLWEILPNETFMAAMRAGEYDVTIQGMPAVHYEEHALFNPNNYTMLAMPGTGSGFLYIRTGRFHDEGEVVPRPAGWHPVQDVNVRRAIFHAMPQQLIANTIQNGLSAPAGTVLAPHNANAFINPNQPMFNFDPDLSRQILDEAGYSEFGADGFRLDLDGNQMYFVFAANDNAFNRDAIPVYLDHWRAIGLDVRLHTGDLVDWNTFLDNILMSDIWSDEVHMFISNWTLGNNPAPHGLWGVDAAFNLSRHRSPEFEEILNRIGSQEAFDSDFLNQAFVDWQRYMFENAVAYHMFWGVTLMAVNNRVANFTLERESGLAAAVQRAHLWAVTAPVGYANTN